MKVLIIQHEDTVPAGSVLEWIKRHHFEYRVHFFSKGNLNENEKFDLIFICGGEVNVDQEFEFPWLVEEKKFISSAIKKGSKIVGLCLGAQLLAESLGGRVFKASNWEIGWHKITLLESNQVLAVLEWHGYQFSSPPGSIRIAESECCTDQGFKWGENILAFQFHPEATEEWIVEFTNRSELPQDEKHVQTKSEILNNLQFQIKMKEWFFLQLDYFTASILAETT